MAANVFLLNSDKTEMLVLGPKKLTPTLLSDLALPYIPTRTLWSQDAGLLTVPRISKQTAGGRAFSYRAPFLWNGLPIDLRDADSISTFKSLLKTHLFSRSYD